MKAGLSKNGSKQGSVQGGYVPSWANANLAGANGTLVQKGYTPSSGATPALPPKK
jgi:hypothetical protein